MREVGDFRILFVPEILMCDGTDAAVTDMVTANIEALHHADTPDEIMQLAIREVVPDPNSDTR
jgi:hypothetical protein